MYKFYIELNTNFNLCHFIAVPYNFIPLSPTILVTDSLVKQNVARGIMEDQFQMSRRLTFRILTREYVCCLGDDRTLRSMVRVTIGEKTAQKNLRGFIVIKIDIEYSLGFYT
jgi:hypothetical protein